MKNLELSIKNVANFATKAQIDAFNGAAAEGLEKLEKGTGAGNDFLGWMHLPSATPEALVADIEKDCCNAAQRLRICRGYRYRWQLPWLEGCD